eukprot:Rmarinus@m.15601
MKTLFFLWLLLIGMCFVSSLPHQPIVYYCFSEDTGTSTVTDCSGNGYHATLSGIFEVDGSGDGTDALKLELDAYALSSASVVEQMADTFTVAFRVKITDLSSPALALSSDGMFSVTLSNGTVSYSACGAADLVSPGLSEAALASDWHHFAFVTDSSDQFSRIYVDGVEVGDAVFSGTCSYSAFYFGGTTDVGSTVVGYSDEYVVFSVALTESDVGEIMDDIDECSTGVHTCGVSCQNTPGSFFCYCGGTYNGCTEVDECALATHDCEHSCVNNYGSFTCSCAEGEYVVGTECFPCATNAVSPDGLECICDTGYTGDGTTTCSDVDECSLSTHNCDDTAATCSNTGGSFLCSCNLGYSGDGVSCTDVLLLQYSFEASGTTVSDNSTTAIDATLSDVVMRQTTNCPQGSCVLFDSDTHEVTIDDVAILQGLLPSSTTAITFMYWAQLDDTSAQATVLYLAEADVSPTLSSYFFSDNLVVRVADSSGSLDRTASLPDGHDSTAWHHVTFVLDFDNDACVFYLDGSLLDSVSLSLSLETTTLTQFYLGHYNGNYHFRGRLDDLRIYGMRLSDDDVLSIASVIDECSVGTDDCDDTGSICTDSVASFTCMCEANYYGDGVACAACGANMESSVGSTDVDDCQCLPGYSESESGCSDDNECTLSTDNCDISAICTNTDGSFTCECPADSYGDGVSAACTACATNGGAPQGSTTNTDCSCNTGYSGDGHTTCSDTDECSLSSDDCDPSYATCTNTVGSFTCACDVGFSGNGVTCADNDECALSTDDCDNSAICTNTDGSFTCECPADSYGDGVSAVCTACATNGGAPQGSTTNTDCSCNTGYSGDGHTTCSDTDECSLSSDDCDPSYATCTNTVGSFTCACDVGYSGDGLSCTDNDECALSTDNCDISAICTNTDGSFTCECPADSYGDGVSA